jgi:hypothetical protein
MALVSFPALAQVTDRIETRPVYGATVTLEAGVRVFRPLPPHDRVIINPGGKTPLYIGIGEGYNGSSSGSGSSASASASAYTGRPYGRGVRNGSSGFIQRGHDHGQRGHDHGHRGR